MLNVNFNGYGKYVTDHLYQWDKNRVLSITGLNLDVVPEIHFTNVTMDKAIVRQSTVTDGVIKADIPNSLLQAPFAIIAYVGVYEGILFKTIETIKIPVITRARPADYTIENTDGEVYSFLALENQIANMVTYQKFNATVASLRNTAESNKTTLEAQIANIVAHNNDTEGNTELLDLRAGADGTIYDSAGNAVRGQFENVMRRTDLIIEKSFHTITPRNDFLVVHEGYSDNGAGVLDSIESFTTYQFIAPESFTCYFKDYNPSYGYLSITLYKHGEMRPANSLGRMKFYETEDTIPTESNPLKVEKGYLVSITVYSAIDFVMYSDGEFGGYKASNLLHFNDTQIQEIDEIVTEKMISDNVYLPFRISADFLTLVKNVYINDKGMIAKGDYNTWYFIAENDFSMYLKDIPASNLYFQIALFRDGEIVTDNFLGRYRNIEGNLPTVDNKLSIEKNYVVAFSMHLSMTDFEAYTNYKKVTGLYLHESIHLNETQRKEVSDLLGVGIKTCKVKYEAGSFEQYATERLNIYIPTTLGYLYYKFNHCVNEALNADNWRIMQAVSVDDNLESRFDLTVNGEWELAVRLKDRSDFSGGIAHGDEVVNNIIVFVDGVKKNIMDITELTTFETLKIVELTTLYDPNDNATVIAEHGREYIFTKDNLTINQVLTWKVAENLESCYMAMFPVSKAVTDTMFTDMDYSEYKIPESPSRSIGNVKSVTVYSKTSGFTATFEIKDYPTGLIGGDTYILTDNGGGLYNKMYYVLCSTGESSEVGEVWKTQTVYTLSVGEGVNE